MSDNMHIKLSMLFCTRNCMYIDETLIKNLSIYNYTSRSYNSTDCSCISRRVRLLYKTVALFIVANTEMSY